MPRVRGGIGYCLTSSANSVANGWYLVFNASELYLTTGARSYAFPVRCVANRG